MSNQRSLIREIKRLRQTIKTTVVDSGVFNDTNDAGLVDWHQALLGDLLYSDKEPIDIFQDYEISLLKVVMKTKETTK